MKRVEFGDLEKASAHDAVVEKKGRKRKKAKG